MQKGRRKAIHWYANHLDLPQIRADRFARRVSSFEKNLSCHLVQTVPAKLYGKIKFNVTKTVRSINFSKLLMKYSG
jgi:hypothetical protein